ncbi:LolA family protein [Shewanella surugensis]|uniref:Outer membrane lipoprotein carrier protein LolA n=1 Tax=Shewanella surugensis TaxID=212020 RepID=A0ABT0LBP0_9GAMM|nr:outer membrane lipoprotein carrier protein LolA [Shewanella surugensis]MCL1124596.1 outer membrane lipoprotein carrier protein LolA [Shewanella surugensis]
MKKNALTRVCYFLILLILPLQVIAQTHDDSVFSHPATEAQLKKLTTQLHLGPSALGDFTQYRQLKVLKKPLISHGNFLFDQAQGLIWQQLRPFKSSLILKDKQLIQIDSQGNIQVQQAGKIPAASTLETIMPNLLTAMLTGDISQLKQNFSLSFQQQNKQWQLGLLPKDPIVKKILPKMIIEGQQTVTALVLLSPNGDSSRIELSHIQNRPLTAEELKGFNPSTTDKLQPN